MAAKSKALRHVNLDELAEADRQWLEAEAERIAADPATLVRMMIRQARVGRPISASMLAPAPLPVPGRNPWPEHVSAYIPDALSTSNGSHVDVDALVEERLAEVGDVGAIAQGEPALPPTGRVQVVGDRQLTPFHIPREAG